MQSESVAENSRSRCKEQDVPFFRFSPRFDEQIAAGETANEKLLNMIITTKLYLKKEGKKLEEIVDIFFAVAESSKDLVGNRQVSCERILGRGLAVNKKLENWEEKGKCCKKLRRRKMRR